MLRTPLLGEVSPGGGPGHHNPLLISGGSSRDLGSAELPPQCPRLGPPERAVVPGPQAWPGLTSVLGMSAMSVGGVTAGWEAAPSLCAQGEGRRGTVAGSQPLKTQQTHRHQALGALTQQAADKPRVSKHPTRQTCEEHARLEHLHPRPTAPRGEKRTWCEAGPGEETHTCCMHTHACMHTLPPTSQPRTPPAEPGKHVHHTQQNASPTLHPRETGVSHAIKTIHLYSFPEHYRGQCYINQGRKRGKMGGREVGTEEREPKQRDKGNDRESAA